MRLRSRLVTLATALTVLATGLVVVTATTANASAYVQLRNYRYGQCVYAPGGTLNVQLQLGDCHGDTYEEWSLVPVSNTPYYNGHVYKLVNEASGYCMEVNNNSASAGARVDQFYCNDAGSPYGNESLWWIISDPTNHTIYQTLRHYDVNEVLDTTGSYYSPLAQYPIPVPAGPSTVQRWLIG